MPIYTYRCRECGHDFEELIFSEAAERALTCPACRAKSPERRMAVFATTSGSSDSMPSCGGGACSACSFDN